MAEGESSTVIIKFAQKLAGNEKKGRTLAMKKLRKWLTAKSQVLKGGLSRDDFMKIWKGLHYCMWMTDKPLVQEELAETISHLVHCFPHFHHALLFLDAYFETECREWFGIDHLRLDKFMMLFRQMFRCTLEVLKSHKWKESYIKQMTVMLQKHIIAEAWNDNIPDGIRYHMADIYLEELDRVNPKLDTDQVHMFLEPYCVALTKMKTSQLFQHIVSSIFMELVNWEVDKAAILMKNSLINKETGKEKIVPSHIQVDYKKLSDRLFELASNRDCPNKNRTVIYCLVKTFTNLADGKIPKRFGSNHKQYKTDVSPKDVRKAAHDLFMLELKLEKETSKARRKRLKKLKRKRARKGQTSSDDRDSEEDSEDEMELDQNDGAEDDEEEDQAPSAKKQKRTLNGDVSIMTFNNKDKKEKQADDAEGDLHEPSSFTANKTASQSLKKSKRKKTMNESLDNTDSSDTIGALDHRCKEDQPKKAKLHEEEKLNSSPADECSLEQENTKIESAQMKKLPSQKAASKKPASVKSPKLNLLDTNNATPSKKSKQDQKKSKKVTASGVAKVTGLNEDKSSLFVGGFDADSSSSDDDDEEEKNINVHMKDDSEQDCITPDTGVASTVKESNGALVAFTKVKRSPPAFVKRAIKKAYTSKTEPKTPVMKVVVDEGPASSPSLSKKKVIFAMNKNKAQDFSESLMVSPVLPFDPNQKPDQGILRSPPSFGASPAVKSPRTTLFKQRIKAADFF